MDGLLRAGVGVPHSCRAGACQSCLLKARGQTPPPGSQTGLSPALVEQGYFLACLARPVEDLKVELPGAGVRMSARVIDTGRLSDSVVRVRLAPETPLGHRAGQYLTLFRGDGLARSYSIASLPSEGALELHVRVIPGGLMSTWLANEVQPGTELAAQGPAGNCFYTGGAPDQPLLLAGTGTGLAPLYGVARDALAQGHAGPIRLFHGALDSRGLYLESELTRLANAHPNFQYHPAPLDTHGPLPDMIQAEHRHLNGWRGFVCGDPPIVNLLRKRFFLAGMASREIFSDAFVPTPPAR